MRTVLLVTVAYFGCAALFWSVLSGISLPLYSRLAAEGVQTQGTITATSCHDHGTVSYTFDADGKASAGKHLSPAGRPCQEVRVGERVDVWYRPADPSVSTLREPRAALESERLIAAIGAAVMSAVLLATVTGILWLNRGRAK